MESNMSGILHIGSRSSPDSVEIIVKEKEEEKPRENGFLHHLACH